VIPSVEIAHKVDGVSTGTVGEDKGYLGNETSLCFNEDFADHVVRSFFYLAMTLETMITLDLLL
jgi:hypothetical protein